MEHKEKKLRPPQTNGMKGKPWNALSLDVGHTETGARLRPARSPQDPRKQCLLRLDGAFSVTAGGLHVPWNLLLGCGSTRFVQGN